MIQDLLSDLALYIISKDLATELSSDIFIDYLPAEPDNIICISEYAGNHVYQACSNRSIQIRIRNVSNELARDLAWKVYNALDFENSVDNNISAQRWSNTKLRSTPFKLGIDENDRPSYVFNMSIITYNDL